MIDLDDFAFLTMCAEEDVREKKSNSRYERSYSDEYNNYDSESSDEHNDED